MTSSPLLNDICAKSCWPQRRRPIIQTGDHRLPPSLPPFHLAASSLLVRVMPSLYLRPSYCKTIFLWFRWLLLLNYDRFMTSATWAGVENLSGGSGVAEDRAWGAQITKRKWHNFSGTFCWGAEQGHGGQMPPASPAHDHNDDQPAFLFEFSLLCVSLLAK